MNINIYNCQFNAAVSSFCGDIKLKSLDTESQDISLNVNLIMWLMYSV